MQPSSGFDFWSLFLWQQLLQVGKGAARVKEGTVRLCEKEAPRGAVCCAQFQGYLQEEGGT